MFKFWFSPGVELSRLGDDSGAFGFESFRCAARCSYAGTMQQGRLGIEEAIPKDVSFFFLAK